MTITYITGGVRSGKSEFAEKLAASFDQSVLYVAFGVNTDAEMQRRIEQHQQRRPSDWGIVEKPYELVSSCSRYLDYEVILVDCFSTWLTNRVIHIPEEELYQERHKQEIRKEVLEWISCIRKLPQKIIIVSSEVGLGGVAMSRLGRFFHDTLGECNQFIANAADEAYAVFSGLPVRLKP